MSLSALLKNIGDKSPAELKEELLKLYETMPPEMFMEHIKNTQRIAEENGREVEREKIVCRFLADGMTVEEIALVLCVKTEKIRVIEENNAKHKIPEYKKALNNRRGRRERNAKR